MYTEFVHYKIKVLVIIMSEAELTHVKSFFRAYREYLDSCVPNVNIIFLCWKTCVCSIVTVTFTSRHVT